MSDVNAHVDLELQDLLDGRLEEPRRTEVERHAATCAQCRGTLDALTLARDATRRLPHDAAPPELRARILAGLDAIDAEPRRGRATRSTPSRAKRRLVVVGVLAAAAAALFLVFRPAADPPVPPAQIAADYRAYESRSLALGVQTAEPATVEAYFRQGGITFPTRVFDLGMMGYTVVGGVVHGPRDQARALFVYRSADGNELTCQMYLDHVDRLPPAEEIRQHNGIDFHIYREGGLTLVFWQEGDVICVMTSDAPRESVIQLAMAKAIRV